MKIGRIILATLAVSILGGIIGALTCGSLFNWVYKLEPTNIWRPMQGPPGLWFEVVSVLLNAVFVIVYAVLRKGIPGRNKSAKGLVFGLCVWAVGMLPGMFATYVFMTIATGVVIYWTILGFVELLLKGLVAAAIYGE